MLHNSLASIIMITHYNNRYTTELNYNDISQVYRFYAMPMSISDK